MESLDQTPPKSPENFKFQIGEATIASERHPDKNEDTLLSLPEKGSFAVFDGVGGRAGGDVASGMSRDYLKKALEALPNDTALEERKKKIEEMFKSINDHIIEAARINSNLDRMGTTFSFVQLCKDVKGIKKIIIANAGDSRVYVLRGEYLEQVTVDDNKVDPKFREKFKNILYGDELTDDYMAFCWNNSPRITNLLGRVYYEPRISVMDLYKDDIVLITSDGVHDNLTDKEISQIMLSKENNSTKANSLIKAAQERSRENHFRSRPDDMTALVVSEAI